MIKHNLRLQLKLKCPNCGIEFWALVHSLNACKVIYCPDYENEEKKSGCGKPFVIEWNHVPKIAYSRLERIVDDPGQDTLVFATNVEGRK